MTKRRRNHKRSAWARLTIATWMLITFAALLLITALGEIAAHFLTFAFLAAIPAAYMIGVRIERNRKAYPPDVPPDHLERSRLTVNPDAEPGCDPVNCWHPTGPHAPGCKATRDSILSDPRSGAKPL
jgi:hypothetical protein